MALRLSLCLFLNKINVSYKIDTHTMKQIHTLFGGDKKLIHNVCNTHCLVYIVYHNYTLYTERRINGYAQHLIIKHNVDRDFGWKRILIPKSGSSEQCSTKF